jgi:hypothetical protein
LTAVPGRDPNRRVKDIGTSGGAEAQGRPAELFLTVKQIILRREVLIPAGGQLIIAGAAKLVSVLGRACILENQRFSRDVAIRERVKLPTAHMPLCAYGLWWRALLTAVVVGLACLLPERVGAQEGKVAEICSHFLGGTNSSGLIAFTREITFPRPPPGGFPRQYFTYCWTGDTFIIAYSGTRAATNVADLVSADKLYGFDGDAYWSLTLNYPSRTTVGKDDAVPLPPARVANSLLVISKDEVGKERGQYVSPPALGGILALAEECRGIIQLGFPRNSAGAPVISGRAISLQGAGRGAAAEFVGRPDRPEKIEHSGPPRRSVGLDYANELMLFTGLQGTNSVRISEVRYHILLVQDAVAATDTFSWQTYNASAGPVVGQVVQDGATRRARVLSNNALAPGAVITPARPIRGGRAKSSPILLVTLVALVGAAPPLLIYLRRRLRKTIPNT